MYAPWFRRLLSVRHAAAAGILAGLLAVALIVRLGLLPRAVMEERHLKRDLPGYADYMARVRYPAYSGNLVRPRSVSTASSFMS